MTPLQTPAARHRSFIMALIGALVIYVAFVFAPGVSSTVVVGFQGKFDNGRFKVTRVLKDTPAKLAGIRAGDIIDRAAGI